MKKFLNTYRTTFILLASIVLGGLLGLIMGPKAAIFEPFGNLFINLLFTIIVPLVFFSVSSTISNMTSLKRLSKILGNLLLVFISTALIAAVIGFLGTLIFNPTRGVNGEVLKVILNKAGNTVTNADTPPFLQQLVNTISVSDFISLFSRKNMLQLIIFSLLFGIAIAIIGEDGKPISKLLKSSSKAMMKVVDIIMYYAPIGLSCYFASIVGQLGSQILTGYLKVFILYLVISIVYYLGFFTLYAFMAGRKAGIKVFWKNAIVPSITALATCSSAACIPTNLEFTKNMGVSQDVAETVIPLGANIHKDGSVIGGVMKITFLLGLFGKDMTSLSSILSIISVSFLVGAVMGAIPNGGMIGEMLIISVYGFSPEVLPIIAVISTIIDAPATLLNSTGNTVCAMMVNRLTEGANWLEKKGA